jgi:hypothetical protein
MGRNGMEHDRKGVEENRTEQARKELDKGKEQERIK